MKALNKAAVIFIAMVSVLFAQKGEALKVQYEKNDTNAKPQVIKAQIQVTQGTSEGIYITLPAGLTAVVRSATLDGQSLWLINSEDKIDSGI